MQQWFFYDLNDTSNEDSLKIAKWQTLAYIFKEKIFKFLDSAYNGLLPKQLCTSIINKGMSCLLYLDLHLVVYSNLLVAEGQSCGMQHIKLFPQCDEHLFFLVPGVRNHLPHVMRMLSVTNFQNGGQVKEGN